MNVIKRRALGFDRIMIALASLLAIGAVAAIYFYDGMLGSGSGHGSGQKLGEISYLENDTRHKDSGSIGWLNAREHQKIYLNDSVFTGAHSQSTIKLDHGDRVDMGENTLIVFSKVDGLDIPNLSGGNFKLFVNDKMKISIGGELTEIEGKGSEIQVYVKPGVKPQVRLLKGEAKIKSNAKQPVALDLGKVAVLETPTPSAQAASAPPSPPPLATPSAPPVNENLELTNDPPVTAVRAMKPAHPLVAPIFAKNVQVSPVTSQNVSQENEDTDRKPTNVDPEVTAKSSDMRPTGSDYREKHSLWIGSGATYMTYAENSNDSSTHVSYASLTIPSLYLEGRYFLSDRWRLLGSFRDSLGQAKSSDTIQVDSTNYHWTTFSGEGMYSPSQWKFTVFGLPSSAGVRMGIQQHSMPFLAKTSNAEVTVENEPVTMATAGAQVDTRLTHSTNFEVYLRYQYPLLSGDAFKAEPGLTFDGSVGVTTMLGSNWSLGGFWYGQMQNYSFSATENGASATGTQQVFFTSVEGRLGYIFP